MFPFKDYLFGDYSGFREFQRDPDFFIQTFVEPQSFNLNSLRAAENFILVGRKGTGKSSCCLALAHQKASEGYHNTFYDFTNQFSRADIKEAVQTQALNLKDISTKKLFDSVVELYDFRELWIRRVLTEVATTLTVRGIRSTFTDLVLSVDIRAESISNGVGRGLEVEPGSDGIKILKKILGNGAKESASISLAEFNKAGLQLLCEKHSMLKGYFFFDELNISHAKSDSSEYETLIALIRDLVRAAALLNDFFVSKCIERLIPLSPVLQHVVGRACHRPRVPVLFRHACPLEIRSSHVAPGVRGAVSR